jgi:hypothetical protein
MLAEKWQVKNRNLDISLLLGQLANWIGALDCSSVAKPRPKLSVEWLNG